MSLIKSISGIRGTIGGSASEGLNPINIVNFTAAFATQARKNSPIQSNKIVVGRDARQRDIGGIEYPNLALNLPEGNYRIERG